MPDERDADLILQIPDAPADGRFADLKSHPGLAEASVLGGRHEIAQMAQFNRGGGRRSHPGSGVLNDSWILKPKVATTSSVADGWHRCGCDALLVT